MTSMAARRQDKTGQCACVRACFVSGVRACFVHTNVLVCVVCASVHAPLVWCACGGHVVLDV